MKTLSLLQPWASLVVLGHKRIETRSWNTKYRGPILIHASEGKYYGKAPNRFKCRDVALDFQQEFFHLQLPHYKDLPFGAIIGRVNLVDTFSTSDKVISIIPDGLETKRRNEFLYEIHKQEHSFGDYSPGRYGWLLSDPVVFNTPIPIKGKLGIWEFEIPYPVLKAYGVI